MSTLPDRPRMTSSAETSAMDPEFSESKLIQAEGGQSIQCVPSGFALGPVSAVPAYQLCAFREHTTAAMCVDWGPRAGGGPFWWFAPCKNVT
jgi:hypothetical protein